MIKMSARFLLTLLVIATFCVFNKSVNAQPAQLHQQLIFHGFENVYVSSSLCDDLVITFENRIYRSQANALARVLSITGQSKANYRTVKLIVLENEQPVLALITDHDKLQAFLNGEISYQSWAHSATLTLNARQYHNQLDLCSSSEMDLDESTRYRPVFPVGLGMRYQLGNYDEPYRFAFDLEPEISLPLARGLSANLRYAIPLYNNFDENRHVRPALATLTQTLIPEDDIFIAISGGIFGRNRYGVHTALKTFLYEEVFSITFDVGRTGFTSLTGRPFFSTIEERTYNFYTLSADYRWRRYDLNTRVQFGRFLFADDGLKVEIHRHFGEVEFGVFGMNTRIDSNFGFFISLPINPSRYRNAGPVRVRPTQRFPVSYRYRGNDLSARSYETGIRLDHSLMQIYPSYLIKEMEKYF